jgi:hypothetical protein
MYVFHGGSIVYQENSIDDETKARGLQVDVLPEPETPEGYYAQINLSLDTHELYYDYYPIPEEEGEP